MKKSGSGGLALLIVVASLPISLAAPPPPPAPAESFGATPEMDNVTLGPDGKLIAWSSSTGGSTTVLTFDLAAGVLRQRYPIPGNVKLRSLYWADARTLLVEASFTHSYDSGRRLVEVVRAIAVDTGGERPPQILLMDKDSRQVVSGAALVAVRTQKPHTVLMSTMSFTLARYRTSAGTRLAGKVEDSGWAHSLFEVDTRTGNGTMVETGTIHTGNWIVDATGSAVARSEWDPDLEQFRVLAKKGSGWSEIYRRDDGSTMALYAPSVDGKAVLAIGAIGDGRQKLWAIPLDGGAPTVVIEDPEYDVEYLALDRHSGLPTHVQIGGPARPIRWLDSAAEARFRAVARAFPGKNVVLNGYTEDYKRVRADVSSRSEPTVYYIVDFDANKADTFGDAYPKLSGVKLGEVETLRYAARDGYPIEAYLTLPPGSDGQNLPLVVVPHGGPESRDYPMFDVFAQFLATRGYAVLQPQFRGSTGFGDAHRLAGYGEWGGLMQDDVSDGVRAMIARGVAAPGRVCIVGLSYGGYAALAGATMTPELYRCAASINGVADLRSMLGYSRQQYGKESSALQYWEKSIGKAGDEKLTARSPKNLAADVTMPILLMHGEDDTVVPVSQSESMANALRRADKPFQFVKMKGEDHWLSRAETRTRVFAELEKFLAANLDARGGVP